MTLQYTIDRMLGSHELTIERDEAIADAYGAEQKANWQVIYNIRGLFWWWTMHGAGRFKESGEPERQVLVAGGGALIPRGTDIREKDRVSRIINKGTGTEIGGPFRIVSTRVHPTHMELSLERP